MMKTLIQNQKYPGLSLSGFTLIELLIVTTIIGIIIAIAAPGFSSWIKDLRLANANNQLIGSLISARNEAIRLQSPVSLCRTGDIYAADPDCKADISGTSKPSLAKNWSHGWLIYSSPTAATDYNPSLLGHELIEAASSGLSDKNVKITSNAVAQDYITFDAAGKLQTLNSSVAVCDNRNGGLHGYLIQFSIRGRPTSTAFEDLNAVDRVCTP